MKRIAVIALCITALLLGTVSAQDGESECVGDSIANLPCFINEHVEGKLAPYITWLNYAQATIASQWETIESQHDTIDVHESSIIVLQTALTESQAYRQDETARADEAEGIVSEQAAILVELQNQIDALNARADKAESDLEDERNARRAAESTLTARTKALQFTQDRLRIKGQQLIDEQQAHVVTDGLRRDWITRWMDMREQRNETESSRDVYRNAYLRVLAEKQELRYEHNQQISQLEAQLAQERDDHAGTQAGLESWQNSAHRFAGLWIESSRKLADAFSDKAIVNTGTKGPRGVKVYDTPDGKIIACLPNGTPVTSGDSLQSGYWRVAFDEGVASGCLNVPEVSHKNATRVTEGWIAANHKWLQPSVAD